MCLEPLDGRMINETGSVTNESDAIGLEAIIIWKRDKPLMNDV